MRTYRNMEGRRFGHLIVVRHHPKRGSNGTAHWICQCDCGRYIVCRIDNLMSGHSTKCSVCGGNRGTGSVFVEGG